MSKRSATWLPFANEPGMRLEHSPGVVGWLPRPRQPWNLSSMTESIEGPSGGPFRHRWRAAFPVSWTMGVVDTYSFDRYQAFTTNQAGNLVVVANEIRDRQQSWHLALFALIGAALGAVVAVWIRRRITRRPEWQVGLPLTLGAVLLTVVGVASLFRSLTAGVEVVTTAVGAAMIAAAVVGTPAVPGWITADTGNYLEAVTAPVVGRQVRLPGRGVSIARSASLIVLGFIFGSLCYTLFLKGSEWVLFIGVAPAVLVVFNELARPRPSTRTIRPAARR